MPVFVCSIRLQLMLGMHPMRGPLLILLLGPALCLAGAAQSPVKQQLLAGGWRFSKQRGNVDIYRRPLAGSRFPALLAYTHMAAPATRLYTVISDYDHFADFIPSVSNSRVIKQDGTEVWVYQRLDFPALASDRHYVIHVSNDLHRAEQGDIRIAWRLDPDPSFLPEAAGAVLPRTFSGYWHLTTAASGSGTDAIYSIHVEPGGLLPGWLFAPAGESYLFDVVRAVQRRAASDNSRAQ
ncbi:MAG: SRPBCC family protein [Gammaproteobacteria bacterium]